MTSKAVITSSYSYVDTQPALNQLVEQIRTSEKIALDTEADSYHHYFEKVCLMQLTLDDRNFIIDPLCDIDMSLFLNLLSQKKLVIHDAGYDLRIMRSSFAFRPHNEIFDTMAAAQLLGYEKFGLTAMLESFFNIKMSKKGQRSDWSKRPLKSSQLQYAIDDTRFLIPLAEKLKDELIRLDRLHWHKQSCENVMRSAMQEKTEQDNERVWRIKGTSRLIPQQLQFIKTLWFWRDKLARKVDLPAFRIMGNDKIIKLALWLVSNPNVPLKKSPNLPRNCKGQRLQSLEKAILKAKNTPPEKWPGPLKRPQNNYYRKDCKELITALRDERTKIADKLGIAPQTLASAATLTNIAYKRPQNIEQMIKAGPMMPWQAQILETPVKKVLSRFSPA
jgi:ribonuclease D